MMTNIYKIPLVLEPQPEGGFTITCPFLSELITEADSLNDVIPNVSAALAAIIEAYQDLNKLLPKFFDLCRRLFEFMAMRQRRADKIGPDCCSGTVIIRFCPPLPGCNRRTKATDSVPN